LPGIPHGPRRALIGVPRLESVGWQTPLATGLDRISRGPQQLEFPQLACLTMGSTPCRRWCPGRLAPIAL